MAESNSHSYPSRGMGLNNGNGQLEEAFPSRPMPLFGHSYNMPTADDGPFHLVQDHSIMQAQFQSGFSQSLALGEFADYILQVEEGSFDVHRVILKNSCEFFGGMFVSSNETNMEYVDVVKRCMKEGMGPVLRYLYSGHTEVSSHNAGAVLSTAILLRLDDVVEQLKKFESSIKVHPGNCSALYQVKDMFKTTFPDLWQRTNGMKHNADLLRQQYLVAFVSRVDEGADKSIVAVDALGKMKKLQELTVKADGELAACMVGKYVYIAGLGENKDLIYKCDTSANELSMEKCGRLNQGRFAHCMASVNGKVYVFGGAIPGTRRILKSIEIYDPETRITDKIGDVASEFDSGSCVGIGNSVYIFGGRQSNKAYQLNTVYEYNVLTKSGKPLIGLPKTAAHTMAVAVGRKVILLGQTMTFVYDVDTGACEERAMYKTGVSFFGLLASDYEVILIGGRKSYQPKVLSPDICVASVEDILSGDGQNGWRKIGTLPKPTQFYRSQCQCKLNINI